MVLCITQRSLEMTAHTEESIKDCSWRGKNEWEMVGVCNMLPRGSGVIHLWGAIVRSIWMHPSRPEEMGGVAHSPRCQAVKISHPPTCYWCLDDTVAGHTHAHTLLTEAWPISVSYNWFIMEDEKPTFTLKRKWDSSERKWVRERMCEGQTFAWLQGPAWKRWSSVKTSVCRTQRHLRESTAARKNKLPFLKDNLTTLTVRRWRKVERQLHPSQGKRWRGFPAKLQQTPKQPPLLPSSPNVQMTSLRETNKQNVPRGKPASLLFTSYSSSLQCSI